MESQQSTKKYKIWYQVFMIIGLLGFIEVVTQTLTEQVDIGYIVMGAAILFNFLFGTQVATTLTTIVAAPLMLSVTWFIPAYLLKRKIQVIENPTNDTRKKYKHAKIIATILTGIVLLIMFFSIHLFYSSLKI
ncbi:MAG: hypothetical protein WD607_07940 [Candidatus Paceibacterota bacterium]